MNIYHQEILKRNFQFILFVLLAVISGISILFSLKVSLKSREATIIAIDGNGTRLVTSQTDPIFNTEAMAFIKKFLTNIYNFDSQNFIQRIGFATNMMSDSLWKSKRSAILDLKAKVESDEISLKGQIVKMTKDEQGAFFALIEGEEKSRISVQNRKVKVAIKLSSVPRTSENPAGMEVDSYEEELVR